MYALPSITCVRSVVPILAETNDASEASERVTAVVAVASVALRPFDSPATVIVVSKGTTVSTTRSVADVVVALPARSVTRATRSYVPSLVVGRSMLTEVASAVSVPEATTPPFISSSTVAPSSAPASFATLTVTVGVSSLVVIVEPPAMLTPLGATTSVVVTVKNNPALLLLDRESEVISAVIAFAPPVPRSA